MALLEGGNLYIHIEVIPRLLTICVFFDDGLNGISYGTDLSSRGKPESRHDWSPTKAGDEQATSFSVQKESTRYTPYWHYLPFTLGIPIIGGMKTKYSIGLGSHHTPKPKLYGVHLRSYKCSASPDPTMIYQ